jgi:hypothetical protein
MFMRDHVADFPIQAMCETLGVSRSGYYAWTSRAESARAAADRALAAAIRTAHAATFDAVHGGQQLRLFNAYYDEYGFQPIVVFDGEGRPVAAMLRPAAAPQTRPSTAYLQSWPAGARHRATMVLAIEVESTVLFRSFQDYVALPLPHHRKRLHEGWQRHPLRLPPRQDRLDNGGRE